MKTSTKQTGSSIRPQDDFYAYVNGAWLAANPIPPSESRWGLFCILRDEAWQNLQTIYDELQSGTFADKTVEQQTRDLYYTAMHNDELIDANLSALNTQLAMIANIKDATGLSACFGALQRIGVNAPLAVIIDADDRDSTKSIFRIHQAGMTLPGREYYLEESPKMVTVREAYSTHLRDVQTYFPDLQDAETFAETVLGFEHDLAAKVECLGSGPGDR